ncbi:hypothetical protein Trydic_g21128 [Trypoxylus dichotomus]
MRLNQAIQEWRDGYEKLILQPDKAMRHVGQPIRTYLEGVKWEVLPHPPVRTHLGEPTPRGPHAGTAPATPPRTSVRATGTASQKPQSRSVALPSSEALLFDRGCNTTSSEAHKFIDGCVCKKIYLHSCAELSVTAIRTINSKKGVSWCCRNCNILSSDDFKAAVLSLRNDLAAREKSAGFDDKAFEELLTELGDRNNRKQNIIMFGVPESDTPDASTRKSQELGTVQAVLKALPSGINTDHIEVHRIDRFVPIKVKLCSSREAHTILKHAKRLRENEQRGRRITQLTDLIQQRKWLIGTGFIVSRAQESRYFTKNSRNNIDSARGFKKPQFQDL